MPSIREKFRAVMLEGDLSKGIPIFEWAMWWNLTLNNWQLQGMPKGVDPAEWFGLERHHQIWIGARGAGCPAPKRHGGEIIIDENDYERILPCLYEIPTFNHEEMNKLRLEQERGKKLLWITLEGPFAFPRILFGITNHLYAFYDYPDLMAEINYDLAEFSIRVIYEVCRYFTPDFVTFMEDMSYNHGPMISYDLMDRFMAPYYEKVLPKVKEHGIIPIIDSDGDIEPLIPWFETAGIEGILPLERMAGVDVNRIRDKHPRWKMVGGFDKTVMHLGEEAIRRELERIKPAVLKGYYIPGCDHQTPPSVSIEDYRLYVRLLKEFSEEISALS